LWSAHIDKPSPFDRKEFPVDRVRNASQAAAILLGQLLAEGLLVSDTPKGPVRLAFPTFIAGYLFPDLYPAQMAPPPTGLKPG
jgi:hypothetical protein